MRIDFKDLPEAKVPVFSYCRQLISEGIDPDTNLEVYRGETFCLGMKVGVGAGLTVVESPSPHFVKYYDPSPAIKG